MCSFLRSTKFKIKVANIFFIIIKLLGLKRKRIISRQGVYYDIDLAEGIDMSLFLFGSFQKHVTDNRLFQLPADAVILDIGANFGAICLPLASKNRSSIIYAFEPTDYGFTKLKRNISLNKNIQERITPIIAFVSSSDTNSSELEAYASWRIDKLSGERHPIHLGLQKNATRRQITLETFLREKKISRLDFIKIDTDGHEFDVLKGAANSLERFNPVIIFELATYILKEKGLRFLDYENFLIPFGYHL